jgi:hypothetical protein
VPAPEDNHEHAYSYALLRVVPSMERGEHLNAGVVLYCRTRDYLGLRWNLDSEVLAAIAPQADLDAVRHQLSWLALVAEGDAAAGAVAGMDEQGRFGWIVAPASTVVQPGPVHTGLCDEPAEVLDRLYLRLVARH